MVKVVGGGFVKNGATPNSFTHNHLMHKAEAKAQSTAICHGVGWQKAGEGLWCCLR